MLFKFNNKGAIFWGRDHKATKLLNSKAAMFGLEGESLKKQFGELFLARLQRLTFRLVEGHQATRSLNSKGAMFGLDARIALAIFGALSVIGGAVLYGSIKESQVVKIMASLEELGKAYDAYFLDTVKELGYGTGSWLRIADLTENNSVKGWKGPYISYENTNPSDGHVLKANGIEGRFLIAAYLDGTWPPGSYGCVSGTVGGDCCIWLGFFGGEANDADLDLFNAFEEKYGDDGSPDTGQVRLYVNETSGTNYIYVKLRKALDIIE